jgi:hypothetical protein
MNEFTKEELLTIMAALDKLPLRWNGYKKGWYSDLECKIQSMIDNYCEHDGEVTRNYATVTQCNKCGKLK